MTAVINLHLDDLSNHFVADLKKRFGKNATVEIRLKNNNIADEILSEKDFWEIIDAIDWSKKKALDKLEPAIERLASLPIAAIYIFADKLSEKLYQLDTRKHAESYAKNEPENYVSADDFLYARCAVIAEGIAYYEHVLSHPSDMPTDIVFEPLLGLAEAAFMKKTGTDFNYVPTFHFETRSNQSGWE